MSAFTVAGPYKTITGGNTTDNTVTLINPGSSLRQKVTVTPIAGPIAFAMNETAVLGTTGGLAAAASLTFMMKPYSDVLHFDQTASGDSFRIYAEDL